MHYYTSDTHAYHANIIRHTHRPFSSVEEMNEALLTGINSVVKEDDWLYHLGDWAWGRHDKKLLFRNAIDFRKKINCRNVVLIFGNHDRPLRRNQGFLSLFKQTADLLEIYDPFLKRDMVLCHYAMIKFNKSHFGRTFHLFGHSHGGLNSWLQEHMPSHLAFDAGVDNAYKQLGEFRPFSSLELEGILAK
jgi:calcineurin-like phosphoesterase family protein